MVWGENEVGGGWGPQVRIEAAGLGLSVVGPRQEVLYGRITGIRLRATASTARLTFEAALQVPAPPPPLPSLPLMPRHTCRLAPPAVGGLPGWRLLQSSCSRERRCRGSRFRFI